MSAGLFPLGQHPVMSCLWCHSIALGYLSDPPAPSCLLPVATWRLKRFRIKHGTCVVIEHPKPEPQPICRDCLDKLRAEKLDRLLKEYHAANAL
jgi:hypothetical protein